MIIYIHRHVHMPLYNYTCEHVDCIQLYVYNSSKHECVSRWLWSVQISLGRFRITLCAHVTTMIIITTTTGELCMGHIII